MRLTSVTIMLPGRVEFERLTISLLMLRPDAVQADDAAAAAQQDAHLSHLADLHQAGELLAVGPVLGPPDRVLRGLGVYRADRESPAPAGWAPSPGWRSRWARSRLAADS